MKKIGIIIIISICVACEKQYDQPIDFKIDLGPNVVCFLADDKPSIEVELTEPTYLNESSNHNHSFNVIKNARVEITFANTNYLLSFVDSTSKYTIDTMQVKIRKGQSYQLNIILPSGKIVYTTCTIPLNTTPTFNINVSTIGSDKFSYSIFWDNDELSEKYYFFSFYPSFNNSNDFLEEIKLLPYKKPSGIMAVNINKIEKLPLGFSNPTNYKVLSYLTTIDIYNYYQSVYNNSTRDPLSPPSPIYTNIIGGIGIFGPLISN